MALLQLLPLSAVWRTVCDKGTVPTGRDVCGATTRVMSRVALPASYASLSTELQCTGTKMNVNALW